MSRGVDLASLPAPDDSSNQPGTTARYTLAGLYAAMKEAWTDMCPCGSTEIIERSREQLQPTLYWRHGCPLNKTTGQPKYTWFKALTRDRSVLAVQKAFKFEPSVEAVAFWLDFLCELRVNRRLENNH